MSPAEHDPAMLLRADRRLRELARQLVRDPGAAEDLAQETWLAALGSGEIRYLPGWLATVVRRLSRDERRGAKRRERRERVVARPDSLPATAELLAREEARRRVVEALLALDEPLRTTMILRFLEELPPRVVAARTNVPVETVRSRTRRGLELLRERLDRSFGDRASWCTALLPLLRPPGVAETLTTAIAAMTLQKMLALAAAVVVLVLGWMAWPRGEREAGSVLLATDDPLPIEGRPQVAAELVEAKEPGEVRTLLPSQPAADTARPSGSLRVRASWWDGAPASGIGIRLVQYDRENPGLGQIRGMTDGAGELLFADVPVGEASVELDRGVWESKQVEAGEEAELAVTIPRCFDLSVLVEDEEGARIPGAEIWAAIGALHDGACLGETGVDGRLRVRSANDLMWFAACARGYKPSKMENPVADEGDEVEIRFVLRRGAGEVAGRVIDARTGEPVPGAFVGVGSGRALGSSVRLGGLGEWARLARTDGSGAFRVEGVAPGACSVVVRARGHSIWRDEIEVREDRTEDLDVALLSDVALEGHVLDQEGRPVAGLSVVVGREQAGWLGATDRTGPDGSFHIGALTADSSLEASVHRSTSVLAATRFATSPGETHVWEARLGELGFLRGRLLDDAEQPLAGWTVEIHDFEAGSGDSAKTAADGGFRFEDVLDHSHLLVAHGAVIYSSLLLEGVRPGEDELVLHVPQDRLPSAHVVGAFLDEQGQPVPGAKAKPWGDDGQSMPVECDGVTGSFDVGPLPPGSWRLNLVPPGRPPVYLGPRALAPGETWDLGEVRLAPEGRVTVRLRLEGIALDQDPRLRVRQQGWWRDVLPGGFALERSASLPPGRHEIVVLGEAYAAVAVPFEIRSGADTTVEVPIRRGYPARVLVSVADRSLARLELRVSSPGDPEEFPTLLGRSRDGTFTRALHLAPGTYTVEARAGERTAEGELRVEPVEGGELGGNVLELGL